MPHFISAIPNTHHSIDNKIIHSVTRDLRNRSWLPVYSRMEVIREGYKPKTRGSTIKRGTRRKWKPNDVQMKVKASYEAGPTNISHFRTSDNYITPAFHDRALDVLIRPQYDEKVITLEFTVRSASRELLQLWSDTVRARTQRQDNRLEHDLQYSYTLEQQSHHLLHQVYKMREHVAPYDETYEQWINKHSSNSLSAVSAGSSWQLEYTEEQIEIIGYLGVKPEPEITEVEDGLYEGTMSYVFTANLPHALVHSYPIMVHQQLFPWKFLKEHQRDYRNVIVFNPVMRGFTEVDRERTGLINTINIPSIDQGYNAKLPDGYYPLVTAMMQVDEDTNVLCNLHDLQDIELDIGILKILINHYHQHLHQPYNTPFLVTLHSNDNLLNEDYVRINHKLDVTLNKPIDKRKIYRLSFSIIIKPHRLSHYAMIPLEDDTRVKGLLADTINNIDNDGEYEKELVNSWILPNDFDDLFYITNILPQISHGFTCVDGGGAGCTAFGGGLGAPSADSQGDGLNDPSRHGHGGENNWLGGGANGWMGGNNPDPYTYNPDDYPEGGWYGDSWDKQLYYHENYRKLYGRSIYGDNPYTDVDDKDYKGSGIDHPDHDIHEYDPDLPESKDYRRRSGRAIVNRFTVMTTIIHSFAKGQEEHKPVVVHEIKQDHIGDN